MADTFFTDSTNASNGTLIISSWLNDVNTNTYTILASVAGTNTLTAIGPSTVTVGYPRGVAFRFLPINANTGAVTINISGLGVKNITKAGTVPLVANDLLVGSWAYIAYDGTQFQLINPQTIDLTKGDGTILPILNGGTGVTTINPVGNCRLVKSGANLVLQPYQGNKLAFPAGYASIPSAGVSLAVGAAVVGTTYFIYAVQTAGVVTSLEFSTTAHTTDTTTGIEIKSGDTTRVLVGMARPITGPAWQDTTAQRFTISWFNQRPLNTIGVYTANRTTTNTGFVELNTEIRNEFLTWGTNSTTFSASGSVTNNVNGGAVQSAIALDSTVTPIEGSSFTSNQAGTNSIQFAMALTSVATPSEGYHFVTLLGATVGGASTALWVGNVNPGQRTALVGLIQG